MNGPSLPEKVLGLHRQLAQARIGHAFGGALALAYYAEPRATLDIDLNIFLAPEQCERALAALGEIGVSCDVEREQIEREGQCRLWWEQTPVDLFFAYDQLHAAMRGAIHREPFAGSRIPILAPEHLLVCKIAFDRAKDWLDAEQMLIGVEELDLQEVGHWLRRILPAGDPRIPRLAGMAEELLGKSLAEAGG